MNCVAEILELLRAAGKTVSTAESITTGYLQTMFGSVSGASDVFKGGITAYKLPVKVELLEVEKELAENTDCVDEAVARQMAKGALKLFQSDYAVAACGYAEKYPARNIEAPFAFIAIADAEGKINFSIRIELSGSRENAQRETARSAIEKFAELLRASLKQA